MSNQINNDGADEPLVNSAKQSRKHAQYGDDVKNFSVKENSKIENGLVESRGVNDILC